MNLIFLLCFIYIISFALVIAYIIFVKSKTNAKKPIDSHLISDEAIHNIAKTDVKISNASATIIVPLKNEQLHIERLHEEFSRQQDCPYFQVIYINDGSKDATGKILEQLPESHKFQFQAFHVKEGKGKKQAIKLALAAAAHELIITVDADTFRDEKWLNNILKDADNDLTILPIKMFPGKTCIAKLDYYENILLQAITYFSFKAKLPVLCNGANLAFRKPEVYPINKHQSGDDIFLLQKMLIENKKIGYNSKASVSICANLNFKDYLNQRIRWNRKNLSYRHINFYLTGLWGLMGKTIFLACLCMIFIQNTYLNLLILLLICLPEFFIMILYLRKLKRDNHSEIFADTMLIRFLSVYTFVMLYQLIVWIIIILSFFVRPTWKSEHKQPIVDA
jgi:cellulose synthase/poly-beta-1,6-N-acetylglucosamine synthase-like glycosyltransferase